MSGRNSLIESIYIMFLYKKIIRFLISSTLIFFCSCIFLLSHARIITVDQRAQFGDRLCQYAIGKWISFKYNIPFYYTPKQCGEFNKYFELLKLSETEKIESIFGLQKKGKKFNGFSDETFKDGEIFICNAWSWDASWKQFDDLISKNIIRIAEISIGVNAFYTERVDWSISDQDQEIFEGRRFFDYLYYASRQYPAYLEDLKKSIAPKNKNKLLNAKQSLFNNNRITVALHIRLGRIYERDFERFPDEISLRVPPVEYYIDQLKRLSDLLKNRPMLVYVFSNHDQPRQLIDILKEKVDKPNIVYSSRENNLSQYENMVEDLFLMSMHDCLIRPNSALSKVAQLIGDHKIVIYPKHAIWKNRTFFIDKIGVINNYNT